MLVGIWGRSFSKEIAGLELASGRRSHGEKEENKTKHMLQVGV